MAAIVDIEGATVVVVDLDATQRRRDAGAVAADGAGRRLAAGDRGDAELRRERRPHVAADAHRRLPGEAGAADRSGARLRPRCQGSGRGAAAPTEAQIYTFLPAVGGAGVTTLAVQTAMLLLNSGGPRLKPSTCLVDLDFQHGAVADYLDLEPRLNLAEIEPRPDRLDRQLLEVMLSYHASGLAVVAAPNRPAEMRSFDPDVVTRLLDLVSTNFEYVVFDMPRTWFSWTDNVLLGSNKLFIVSETTVPACATPSNWWRRSRNGSATGQIRRSSSTALRNGCSRPAYATATSSRRWAKPSRVRSPTITSWCARRSTAACHWMRLGMATRSPRNCEKR